MRWHSLAGVKPGRHLESRPGFFSGLLKVRHGAGTWRRAIRRRLDEESWFGEGKVRGAHETFDMVLLAAVVVCSVLALDAPTTPEQRIAPLQQSGVFPRACTIKYLKHYVASSFGDRS